MSRGHPWSHTTTLDNLECVGEELCRADLKQLHPARLFLMVDQVTRGVGDEHTLPHPHTVPDYLRDSLEMGLKRAAVLSLELFPQFVERVRAGGYEKPALLSALNYPWIDARGFQRLFNELCGAELYFAHEEVLENPLVPQREFSWQNISSEPMDMVRALLQCASLPKEATFSDLGCGGGGSLFPFALLTEWTLEGIEIERHWCDVAKAICERIHRPEIVIRCEDLLNTQYGGRNIYYIYSPFRDSDLLPQFVEHFNWQIFGTKCQLLIPQYPPLLRELRMRAQFNDIEKFGDLHRLER